ncbi:hypothetical protein [Wolbachia endosymbiont of Psylliodes chrysocephala]|uniref:hypothetical protein n=1 Tax=Wolbachia endosymbiont of Psylliodes chrysocephala TaxID=2883236 RepID=UPI0020A1160A|nr:hypothetical protein [Wolbachia endosymbiont of Psylliodes chrysocephala]
MTWLKEPKRGVIPVWNPASMQPHQKHSFSIKSATFYASLLAHKQTFLDPSVKALE